MLDRLSVVGLTVNGDKCEFRLSKLTFFGHKLTSDGVNPSEEKVAVIRDARSPKDASEVQSFIGLVQYLAKFMPDVASNSRVDQKERYLQVGQRTADSFSRAEVSNSSGHELLQMSLVWV